jgi:hypothetical protein
VHRESSVQRLRCFDTETQEEFELTAVEGVGFSIQFKR